MTSPARIDNRLRAYFCLLLAAVAFLAANVWSGEALNGLRFDLTERKLFTISDGTREVIGSIEEPLLFRLFFSKALGERQPDLATHFERVHGLLKQYVSLSQGKIRLEILRPEPFSTEEDRALAYGLQATPVDEAGEPGYFGMVGLNSTDDQTTIPFFTLERESFLEYDLTKVVHSLVNPVKKLVGVISTLPVHGRHAPPFGTTPRWPIMGQLNNVFDVLPIDPDARTIPDNVELLLIIQPTRMTDETLYAIEQFVLGGGRALVFVDPFVEAQSITARTGRERGRETINKLLGKWGTVMVPDKVAADIEVARRVNVPVEGRLEVLDYVAWLSLGERNFNRRDLVMAEMSRINLATPGILEQLRGPKTDFTPLMSTGAKSMRLDVEEVAKTDPDVVGMFRNFKPSGNSLTVAARLTGEVRTAYPDGPPPGAPDELKANHRPVSEKPIDVIVVADADMLHQKFWADMQVRNEERVAIPFANNADFVVNALDTLGGAEELVGLRARRESSRPFDLVDEIRREAERQYRSKEKALIEKIQEAQLELDSLVTRENATAGAVLSTRERGRIDALRRDVVTMRQELRQVQHALRQDIEQLDGLLKFLNIGAVPLVLALLTVAVLLVRRRASRGMAR